MFVVNLVLLAEPCTQVGEEYFNNLRQCRSASGTRFATNTGVGGPECRSAYSVMPVIVEAYVSSDCDDLNYDGV